MDYYEVLNISKGSSSQEIRRAYKFLAKKWHPDKHPLSSKPEAEARFKAISQAYEALDDQECRRMLRVQGNKVSSYLEVSQRESMNNEHLKTTCYSMVGEVKRKPIPVERELECTLEELYWGCTKEVKFTRDVITKSGLVIQKPKSHTIHVKPGWKKGTRIVFESTGGGEKEKPGHLGADFVFMVSEQPHPLFKRVGDDLVMKVMVPLVTALTGSWSFSFRLINGEKMSCSFHKEIVSPEFEKVIKGQGMPLKGVNMKGDLRIKFHIVFPEKLSEEQRRGIREILKR